VSAGPPISPCIAVCVLDPATGYCRGCFRTIAEISAWVTLGAQEKQRILDRLPLRRQPRTAPTEA
jgi:predicted Fe-S protein YdhL (DUF1289 family)